MIKSATRLVLAVAILLTATASNAVAQIDNRNGNQFDQFNQMSPDGNISQRSSRNMADSLGTDKEIPKGIKVWTVDQRFGDRRQAELDTMSYMYPNTIFTTGLRGEYNTTGNLGAPRINRIFINRAETDQFLFTQPYDYIVSPVDQFHFTNTLSPFTNLDYNTAGNRTNGEDHFKAKFAVNAGKRLGVGFNVDYMYGRGFYSSQSTSHFKYLMYGSYIGNRYQAHLIFSTLTQKVTENGGITNDEYIKHPESFDDNYATNEIPTVLERNWNRNNNLHVFLTHRYNLGFNRKVKMSKEEIEARKFAMASQKENQAQKDLEEARRKAKREGREFDEKKFKKQTFSGRPDNARVVNTSAPTDSTSTKAPSERIAVNGKAAADSLNALEAKAAQDTMWMKNEYVPVTSFIHTMKFDTYRRIYQAYETPKDFYADTFNPAGNYPGDSIYDKTTHYRIQNTFAISLLEGFNKWAKAGLKAFVTSDLRHFTLPTETEIAKAYNEHNLSIGGQLIKSQGKTLHYDATLETWLTGKDAGQMKIDADADINFALFGDTVRLQASGFFHRLNPTFYYRHYHSKHFWWDNDDMSKIIHTRIEGKFGYEKTKTTVRVAFDNIKNHTFFAMGYNVTDDFGRTGNTLSVVQKSGAISLLTLELQQKLKLGPLHWDNVITYQKSSDDVALPVPDLNIYTNLFLRFKIARVLKCDFGADARFFTKYYAPDYSPALGQYAVQTGENRTEVGNYPIVNVYANFHLQRTRFFVMMSHINAGQGKPDYFLAPHYPLNQRIFRFGVSWNFYN
ncbi:putative porin [Prevotella sp.]|uniref:putative porin n=1 Tax=Prevotella sp. TaxID=59823 RepID=UPI002A828002|nr:putative porin [Prevotella sp.]MDY4645347.1 putative porin [Prevotella sp.]